MNELEHDDRRKSLGRTGYINWRMRDLPGVYQDLMPYSYNVSELAAAETAIRTQYETDRQHCTATKRQLGPPAVSVLDWTGFDENSSKAFLAECGVKRFMQGGDDHVAGTIP